MKTIVWTLTLYYIGNIFRLVQCPQHFFLFYLDAVKICLELVHMALMGLSWPLTSPMGVKLSTFHTFSMPPRQALSSMGRPGTYARAHTQSLWALGICCGLIGETERNYFMFLHIQYSSDLDVSHLFLLLRSRTAVGKKEMFS